MRYYSWDLEQDYRLEALQSYVLVYFVHIGTYQAGIRNSAWDPPDPIRQMVQKKLLNNKY